MGCLPLSHSHHDRDRQTPSPPHHPSPPRAPRGWTYCKRPTAAIPTFLLKSIKNFPAGKLFSFPELEHVTTAQLKHFNCGHYSRFTQWSIYCIHSCNRFWSHLKTAPVRELLYSSQKNYWVLTTEMWERQNSLHAGFRRWAHSTQHLKKTGV